MYADIDSSEGIMQAKRKATKKWILVILVLLIVAVYIIFDSAIRPAVLSLAETKLKSLASKAVSEAVNETFGSGISYSDLINIEKDESGKIKLLSANAGNINNLASKASSAVQDKIAEIGEQGIDIPLGTIIGGPLLSGRGPSINVRIDPTGYVNTQFLTAFEHAGINQTRHIIYLLIHVDMKIIIANTVKEVRYESQQMIADNIIVGDIPEQYMQLDNMGGMQNLAPMLMMDQLTNDNTQ